MPRYALKIEYNGAPFAGWQRQKDQPSVQQTVENALCKLEPNAPGIFGAGRTDTGVHATGQIAHVDLVRNWDAFCLIEALNYHLKPMPIAILDVAIVDTSFHARFSAIRRHYHFRLISRRAPVTHDNGLVWQVKHTLDLEAMQNAARLLLGKHDFTTFRSTQCQAKSPVKTLETLDIERHTIPYGYEFRFQIKARSFLHNQVRSFVGTLERVGAGAWSPEDVEKALKAKNRAACGPVCPPQGLYLSEINYPNDPFRR